MSDSDYPKAKITYPELEYEIPWLCLDLRIVRDNPISPEVYINGQRVERFHRSSCRSVYVCPPYVVKVDQPLGFKSSSGNIRLCDLRSSGRNKGKDISTIANQCRTEAARFNRLEKIVGHDNLKYFAPVLAYASPAYNEGWLIMPYFKPKRGPATKEQENIVRYLRSELGTSDLTVSSRHNWLIDQATNRPIIYDYAL